jgi:hypothetical protein
MLQLIENTYINETAQYNPGKEFCVCFKDSKCLPIFIEGEEGICTFKAIT